MPGHIPFAERRYELAKACEHPPRPVEDFQPFPWHLELADVPNGAYWVPSERFGDDEAPGIVQTLRRFLDSSRFPN